MPLFGSPSTHFMAEHHAHVFSIIKDGNKDQTFTLRVTNQSSLAAHIRVALPFDGQNTSFLVFAVLPARQQIRAFETKSFTIKIKSDFKRAGLNDVSDLHNLLGLGLETDSLSSKPSRPYQQKGPTDQEIKTLIGLQVVDSDIQVVIPFRIHYKQSLRLSRSFNIIE